AQKWGPGGPAPTGTTAGTRAWSTLGPAAARSEWNGTYYSGDDTGRPTAIRVDPATPGLLYVATSGGGVWATSNFGSAPNWSSITDTLGALAIGSMDLFPSPNGNQLVVGTGDAFEGRGR